MTATQPKQAAGSPELDNPDQQLPATDLDQQLQTPLLNVTRGNPTAEELAAVTAVVLAMASNSGEEDARPSTRPSARRAQLHLPPKPGTGSWRRSSR